MKKSILFVIFTILTLMSGCVDSNNKNGVNDSSSTSEIESIKSSSTYENDTFLDATEDEPIQNTKDNEIINETKNSSEISADSKAGPTKIEFTSYVFKENEERVINNKKIRLLELATEEGVAVLSIDGDRHRFVYNTEQEIKGNIIKITDLDGIFQTVKIMIK